MRKTLVLLAVFAATSIGFSSCGKKEENAKTQTPQQETKAPKPLSELESQNGSLPKGHPPINNLPPGHPPVNSQKELEMFHSKKTLTKIDKPVEIPKEVEKTWKFATVDIVDKKTGKPVKEVKVKKGDVISFKGMEIKVLYIVPQLVVGSKYTSASNEPRNPAILVVVKKDGKTVYAGPIYKLFPKMYNINDPEYIIILKDISKG